jgi:hypothetical protein
VSDTSFSRIPNRRQFWANIIRSVEAEPREATSIPGKSGLFHPVVASGVDELRKRFVLISGDPDARSAAMAQSDIQGLFSDYRVVLARPIAVNLGKLAEAVAEQLGNPSFQLKDFEKIGVPPNVHGKKKAKLEKAIQEKMGAVLESGIGATFKVLAYASVNPTAAWQEVISQLSHLQFEGVDTSGSTESAIPATPTVRFGGLLAFDPAEVDRRVGVCSIPLYSFSEEEAEKIYTGTNLEEIRAILQHHDIFQYFFPSADQVALGLVEREALKRDVLVARVSESPSIGHPLGQLELVSTDTRLDVLIDALEEKGLCVEGEHSVELTDAGRSVRTTVKWKPREGFIAKLSRIVSMKVDLNLRDLFDGGK